jgi:hypothetical protein|nr:MAG TPA: hypothetical protein [Inoviridae sp.]
MRRVWYEGRYTTKNFKLLDEIETLLEKKDFDVDLYSISYICDLDSITSLAGVYEISDHNSRDLLMFKNLSPKWNKFE